MSAYIAQSIAVLKKAGLKLTIPRQHILEILDSAKFPLNAYNIVAHAKPQYPKLDTVTVYRVLKCFRRYHLIHEVLSSGKFQKCDHVKLNQCHHLAICTKCGKSIEVPCKMPPAPKSEEMRITGHKLEFIGICKHCDKKSKTT